MPHNLEPHLTPVEITSLKPTQMTVGLREVEDKRRQWAAIREEKGADFLGHHMVPVVLGHKQRLYLVDHHHLALALHEEGVKHVLTSIVADLSHLGRQEFWSVMDHRNFVYPFDVDGVRHPIENLPKRIVDLKDDPFRALAGAVRDAGGFAKIDAPFSEFLWADFLRRRVGDKKLRHSFEDAVEEAMQLARSRDARHLPGWCGADR
ncbi:MULTISPECIES: ParB-like protein [Agrobacterium]|uniref:Chromosome partitioning protein ParB n=1 Tax=Agrobacterium tumefaciens TaxID=358 RepID=A0AAJ4N598_AGRTU|nr:MULTISPECIES: ParB-like protein [Agrobacterium]NSY50935.1 chromosome partitioning protein ParB [Agrobacterium tumefaciens]NTA44784.1 chromosome partitioning protein ParB [Agrobacterium tumefaciens]NTA61227.1 chromosome partitioning protein ParB [Agrobacterium tumefaciens]QTG14976.1 chromosome partitioning protein ParB [Agrobacterium tumefaciens]UXU07756.1 chromosome partitioning protein ParB [Agrobacterium tumefaciens]